MKLPALITFISVFIIISSSLSFSAETEFISPDLEKLSVPLKLDPIASKKLIEMISRDNGENTHLIRIKDPEMLDKLNNIMKNKDFDGYRGQNPTIILNDLDQNKRFEFANEVKVQFAPMIYYIIAAGFGVVGGWWAAEASEPDIVNTYIIENSTFENSPVQINSTIDTQKSINISYEPDYALGINLSYEPDYVVPSCNLSKNDTTSQLSAHVFSAVI